MHTADAREACISSIKGEGVRENGMKGAVGGGVGEEKMVGMGVREREGTCGVECSRELKCGQHACQRLW